MCIRNRLLSLIYKIAIVIVSGLGLYLYSGLPEGALNLNAFKYYTILSNALVFLFYIFASIYVGSRLAKKGARGVSVYMPHFSGAVLMAITVTLLIYQFLLAPQNFVMPGTADAFRNNIVHLVVPLMVLGDWLFFARKGRFAATDPFAWEVIPLLYFLYAVVAAELGVTYAGNARYPYFFINADEIGWGQVLINVALLCAAFLVLGYLLFGLDRLLGAFAKKPGAKGAQPENDDDKASVDAPGRGKKVYKAGDAQDMTPADSVVETPPVEIEEKAKVIVVEKPVKEPAPETPDAGE